MEYIFGIIKAIQSSSVIVIVIVSHSESYMIMNRLLYLLFTTKPLHCRLIAAQVIQLDE